MNYETIVAVFDQQSQADAAIRELEAILPKDRITRHAQAAMGGATSGATGGETGGVANAPRTREPGFWSSLFGGEPEHDAGIYDRSIERGSTVVTVRAEAREAEKITSILERHNPADLNDRAQEMALPSMRRAEPARAMPAATTGRAGPAIGGGTAPAGRDAGAGDRMELAEERLKVGKRAINRGTTRVRRYVVETPVEEQVTLRGETVAVERRPVADGRAANAADFSDKVLEMTETDEEPVISKDARVKEEVVLSKSARDRTETVRDTVRREDVEIDKPDGRGERGIAGGPAPAPRPGAAQGAGSAHRP